MQLHPVPTPVNGSGLASGPTMAALCTVVFAVLNQRDHLVGTSSVHGPLRVVMEHDFSRFGVELSFVDTADRGAASAPPTDRTPGSFSSRPRSTRPSSSPMSLPG